MIQYLLPAIQTKNLENLTLMADIGETHDMEKFMQWVKDGAEWLQIEYTLCTRQLGVALPTVFRLVLSFWETVILSSNEPKILLHLVCGEYKSGWVDQELLLAERDLYDPRLLDYIELFTSDEFIAGISSIITNSKTMPSRLWLSKASTSIEQYVQNSLEAVQATT